MNKESPYRDQAERLRKKVEKTWEPDDINKDKDKESLPPRSRLHREKKQKSKWKVKYPIIRLLALMFVLLPIAIYSIYHYMNNGSVGSEKVNKNQDSYETIGFEEPEKDKGTIIEERKDEKETDEIKKVEKKDDLHASPAPKTPVLNDEGDKGSITPVEQERNNQVKHVQEGHKLISHTVQPNETIFRIAMKYYRSQEGIEIIKKANNLKSNEIWVGQVLSIPLKGE